MENIQRQTDFPCSGCAACAAICPRGAIRLEPDDSGLLTARVNETLCIDCGLCINVCDRFSDEIRGRDLRESPLYAVQSTDAVTIKNCSSGGLAHELAVWTLRRGGKVVGAVYDTQTDRVRHETVCSEAGIAALDGSKYLQSDPQEAFGKAIAEAKRDPSVSFTVFGTPCQIAGLAKACEITKVRGRFILVEIFCHGVPPYGIWENQLERMRKKLKADRFDSVRFRYKKDDWHSYCIRADAGNKTFYGSREREPFWHIYFENVLLGDACMTCRLRKEISSADLRIGDYWGRRYQNRSDGVSAAFALTDTGRAAMEELLRSGAVTALDPSSPEEMLRAQNMAGYANEAAHRRAMELIKNGAPLKKAVRAYRRMEPAKRRLKRAMLRLSYLLPGGVRARLKRARSAGPRV
ncbi:MAG: Coenzyme F420 hydrogenase/dehydrogenase, beta subunit C-terminal domain [Clostridia bacterium]|nr:Coenzyme F420 hydrogenase/dehydrogenase, beta subunit C-terminal domain [Clostridia bacterium]